MLCTAQNRSVRALFATEQQPHVRDIFLNQKNFPLDKLINQEEGILAYKLINGTYLLGDVLADRHHLHHYQLRNDGNLRIQLSQLHTVNYLFFIELSKLGIVYQVIYVEHHPSRRDKLKRMLHEQQVSAKQYVINNM